MRSSSFCTASTGASAKRAGSTPTTADPAIRATGCRPDSARTRPEAMSDAMAPSLSGDEFPAVTDPPSENAAGNPARAVALASGRIPSSWRIPPTSSTRPSWNPAAQASRASSCERSAHSSCARRSTPTSWAISSAERPSDSTQRAGKSGLTMRQPMAVDTSSRDAGSRSAVGASTCGARLIPSTPPAITTSASPARTMRAAWTIASAPDPHNLFTVSPAVSTASPASSAAMRATLRLSSPAPFASPNTTSSTPALISAGLRWASARIGIAARSSTRRSDSAPRRRPNGVRTASTR